MPNRDQQQAAGVLGQPPSPLDALNLAPADLAALRRQGFVKRVARGRQGVTYQLCFRVAEKQVSRALGRDEQYAAAVQQELDRLRAPLRFHRASVQGLQKTRALWRACKQQTAADLSRLGLYFHGHHVRRRRGLRELLAASQRSQ
jgi:hypothetical protein